MYMLKSRKSKFSFASELKAGLIKHYKKQLKEAKSRFPVNVRLVKKIGHSIGEPFKEELFWGHYTWVSKSRTVAITNRQVALFNLKGYRFISNLQYSEERVGKGKTWMKKWLFIKITACLEDVRIFLNKDKLSPIMIKTNKENIFIAPYVLNKEL